MTIQQKIKQTMAAAGIPYKEINVYGRQIVVTAWSREAAERWSALIAKFARFRGMVHSRDDNVVQLGRRLHESHEVWRAYGVIE